MISVMKTRKTIYFCYSNFNTSIRRLNISAYNFMNNKHLTFTFSTLLNKLNKIKRIGDSLPKGNKWNNIIILSDYPQASDL